MVLFSLLPGGILQVWDVVQHGYWHARSLDAIGSPRALLIEWLRLPGDLVFILFGAIPVVIAAIKGWLAVHAMRPAERAQADRIGAPPLHQATLPAAHEGLTS
jgi:nitric oxide reductase subunit B